MKIVRNTPDVFIAERTPWLVAAGLFFAFSFVTSPAMGALAGGGLWALLAWLVGGGAVVALICIFVERQQVILDRPAGHIVFRRRNLLRHAEDVLPLDALLRAETETRVVRSAVHRTVLLLNAPAERSISRYPLGEIFSGGQRAMRLACAINTWLCDHGAPACQPHQKRTI